MRSAAAGRLMVLLALAALVVLACAMPAFAYDEPHGATEYHDGTCVPCHVGGTGSGADCASCHASHGSPDAFSRKGPHGLYSSTSDRCAACHTLHDAGGAKLLSAATVAGSCVTCHDGTGGRGVYGAIKARTGVEPAGAHRIDTATIVPGGSDVTGGDAAMALRGPGSTLTCDDCHSPHDNNTVAPYGVERWRTGWEWMNISLRYKGLLYRPASTTHLLRRNPGGSAVAVNEYGADWCAACHKGRMSGGAVMNHPVDRVTALTPVPFTYSTVALLASDDPTSLTTTGTMAGTNRGYLMPFPRTTGPTGQGAHAPICQQCHEDARNVGTLSADGALGDANPSTITTPDGASVTDNPRFQNFPHETTLDRLLVERYDDLCLNCHPPAVLP